MSTLSKPIQERIFKSRLTISYRTNITGTVQQEKLPYRLLVIGEFDGRSARQAGLLPDLAKRGVRSIKRGTTVDDHLSEIVPTWRIPAALSALRSYIPGKVVFDRVTCSIPATALAADPNAAAGAAPPDKKFSIGGAASFLSEDSLNGLCTVSGELRVGGTIVTTVKDGIPTPKEAKVVLAGTVRGVYTDPTTGKVLSHVTGLVDVQNITLDAAILGLKPRDEDDMSAQVNTKIKEFVATIGGDHLIKAERTIPITSMEGFTPDEVARAIPEVHRLRVIKQLLMDLQAGLRNRPDVRKRLKDLLPAYGESADTAKAKLDALGELKTWAEESFPLLAIEHGESK